MSIPAASTPDPQTQAGLEQTLGAVESRLALLGDALRARDPDAIDHHATELHGALVRAVDCFTLATQRGPIPAEMRRRLAIASGQVAAQRESLARATAALDRAIDVLIPRDAPSLYSAGGARDRSSLGGSIQA
jgi:hypothetical protein